MALDLQRYLGLYVSEAGEHLAAFGRELVRLEQASAGAEQKEIVDTLFRHAHSVKGMSASMQLEGIASLAHGLEDLVAPFRADPARLDAAAVDLLLAASDALSGMVQDAAKGDSPAADAGLASRLAEAGRRYRDRAEPRSAPSSVPAVAPAAPAPGEPAATAAPAAATLAQPAEPPPSRGRALRRVQVEVEIAGSCPVPAVRGFLVVKKLGALGAVAQSKPSVDELRAGRIPGKKLAVLLDTAETLQAIERALAQIADLAGVVLREAEAERAPAPPPAAAAGREPADGRRTVRVRTEILDGFLDTVGELILATARIRELGRALPPAARPPLDEGVDRLHAIVKDLHDKVMRVRMTPLSLVTEQLPRAARDVARRLGKQVEVEIRGAEIELDRAILEELSDPVLHVLRNAVDHGIEAPHLRLLAGKAATGVISVSARRERDRVILDVADDGKGMDPERLRAAAVARGALRAEQAAELPDREALLLACLPGVSTAETVTDVSGRGVGLDAVKRTVEGVGGAIEIDSAPGRGSRVTFRLPLTVAVQPVLLVRVGEEVLGVPIAKVHGAAQVTLSQLERSQGTPVIPHDGALVPVHDLARLLGFPGAALDERAVVIADGGDPGLVGLAVDALLGQHEAVLKPLGEPLELVPGLSAVTVLGNGRPVFILDVPRLLGS